MEWISQVGRRTFSIWQQSLRKHYQKPYDYLVVGGGIGGASTAYWLRQLDPTASILLLEVGRVAQGASGRNAGFLLQGSAEDFLTACNQFGRDIALQLWRFSRENQRLVREQLDPDLFDHAQTGSFIAAGDASEASRLQDSEGLLRELDFNVRYFGAEETNRRLKSDGFYGSLYCPEDGIVHPAKLVHHILDLTQVEIHEGEAVVGLSEEADGMVDVDTDVARYKAKKVCLALNAYLPTLLPETARYVRPVRAQMMAFRSSTAAETLPDAPVYSHQGFFYTRKSGLDEVLVGGARHLHEERETGYEDATTTDLQKDLRDYLNRHFPHLVVTETSASWSGVMGFSPDHIPVLGCTSEVQNAHFVTGFTGHGMGYGFHMGKMIAAWITSGQLPDEARLFHIDRFDQMH